jgi:hypothetical protein
MWLVAANIEAHSKSYGFVPDTVYCMPEVMPTALMRTGQLKYSFDFNLPWSNISNLRPGPNADSRTEKKTGKKTKRQ